jgi:hypothetical protein
MPTVLSAFPGPPPPRCPSCGSPARRVVRQRGDLPASAPATLHRYRCTGAGAGAGAACGWQGWLARPAAGLASSRLAAAAVALRVEAASAVTTLQTAGRRLLIGLATVAAVVGPLAVIGVASLELLVRPAAGLAVAPGESHDGLALRNGQAPIGGHLLRLRTVAPRDMPAGAVSALTLRQGCAWGQPGRQPYRGTTEQALSAAGLPPEVVQQISALRQAGRMSGRLEISREAIRQVDGVRTFNPGAMAMSFGLTLCLNSRVNFAPGHVELADLYQARDAMGRLHFVMVPDVCGNVTVLAALAPRGLLAALAAALAQRSEDLAMLVAALVSDADPDDPGDAVAAALGGDPDAGTVFDGLGLPAWWLSDWANAGCESAAAVESGPSFQFVGGPWGSEFDPNCLRQSQFLLSTPKIQFPNGPGAWMSMGDGAGAPRALPPRISEDLWRGLRSSTWPRQVSIAGLKSLADGLARSGQTLQALATLPTHPVPPNDEPGAGGFTAYREVPEPGSLACALVALLAAWWVARRRSSRQSSRRSLRP